jgi:uncharacterized repeat protein (TIGR02543 family)
MNVQGKALKLSYKVSFNTNMASGRYYYISGQSGTATTQAAPATRTVPIGGAIGVLPSTLTNKTYILNSVTYTISVTGWYTEQGLTNKVDTYWVPTSDCTLYAKWEMTADKTISAAVTIPKFASGVSWVCYSNGGSRSAVTATCSGTTNQFAFAMAAPGATRNSNTYTWSGCGGKTITALSSQSMTLNGVTKTVTTPGAGGSWTQNVRLNDFITCKSNTGIAAGSKTYSSGNYKVILSWGTMIGRASDDTSVTIKFYYANALKQTYTLCTLAVSTDNDNDVNWNGTTDVGSNRNGTFASGNTYGAAGGYAVTRVSKGSQHNSSIAAASGTGYSRTITVKK